MVLKETRMDDPAHLRLKVAQLHAMAFKIRGSQPAYADLLIERAEELHRQAIAVEAAEPIAARKGLQPAHQLPSPLLRGFVDHKRKSPLNHNK